MERGADSERAGRGRGRTRWGRFIGLFKPWLAVLVAAPILWCAPSTAKAQAPDEAWRTLETEHFRVTFPEGLEGLARHAADRAEWAYGALEGAFIDAPDGLIDVLVTDHTDVSNGFAQVFPSNRITVFARPPVDLWSLAYFDDWMELVILHELAHVVHLDYTRNPLGKLVRAIFGRPQSEWPLFPSLGMPRWVIEGLATWYESRLTGAGRVRGTFHEMQIRTALIEGRFEGVDQASGDSPLWPAGNRSYVYGSAFFEYLLDKHGAPRLAAFVEAVAGQWIPFRVDAAGRDAFGASVSDEWSAWRGELEARYEDLDARLARLGPISEPERLTRDARWGFHPTVAPDGGSLVYVRADGRSDTQLTIDEPAGGAPRQLTRTNGLSTFSWMPDGRLLVSQLELQGPYRSFGDLYLVAAGGGQSRVTTGARLTDPSVAPDGRSAVAVRQGGGTSGLARVDLESGALETLVAPQSDVHWAFPRLSPDGRWIAATRWERDASSDIVVLDARSGAIAHRVTRDRAVDLAPAWSADGRWLVWSSDRSGTPNVLGVPVDAASGRPGAAVLLTNMRTGATFPSLDPSGTWLYFTAYHVDGWEVERLPFRAASAPPAPAVDDRFDAPSEPAARGAAADTVRPYSAGPTLAPTYWEVAYREPIAFAARTTSDGYFLRRREALGYAVGAQTSGFDLVGRHSFSALARVFTQGGELEAGLAYAFAGLGNPLIGFSLTQSFDGAGQIAAGTDPDTLFVLEREREAQAALTLRAPRFRHDLSLTVSGALVWERRQLLDERMRSTGQYTLARPASRLGEFAASARFATARSHPFQLGATRGVNLFVQGRTRVESGLPDSLVSVAGADRSFSELVGRARASIPLWTTGRVAHVLALQASGGVAGGPGAGAVHFDVGGASGQAETLTGSELFGGGFLFFPVRGYDTLSRFGRFAWAASAEYRFPIALVNRGWGAWPVHLDRLVGALFADVGNAWGPTLSSSGFQNPLRSPIASAGAEVTTAVLAAFDVTLLLRTGLAFPFVDGAGPRVYLRVGLPF